MQLWFNTLLNKQSEDEDDDEDDDDDDDDDENQYCNMVRNRYPSSNKSILNILEAYQHLCRLLPYLEPSPMQLSLSPSARSLKLSESRRAQ